MNARFIKLAILFTLFTLLPLFTAQAKLIELPGAQISVEIPEKWQTVSENGTWNIKSPDGEAVGMVFVVLETSDMEAAVKEAEKSIVDAIGPLDITADAVNGELNGLKYIEQQATAMEKQITVSLTLILSPNNKWLMVAYFGQVAKEGNWQADVAKIAASVKAIQKTAPPANALSAALKLLQKKTAPTSPQATSNSFPMPFNANKALAALFAAPTPSGEASWQPTPGTFAKMETNPGNAMAKTKSIGFKSYDYDETTTQILFIYKSSFPKASEPMFGAVIGAALFNCENGVCKTIWNNPALIQFSTYEDESEFKFVSIGQGCHGALIEAGDIHQGITVTNAILLAVHNNSVVVAAKELPVYEDNAGAAEEPSQAYKFKTSIEFVPGAHKSYYNMKVKFSGTTLEESDQGGKMVSKVVPANFVRSFFWDDTGFYEEETECDGPEDFSASTNVDQNQQKLEAMLPVFDSVVRVFFSNDGSLDLNHYSSKNANLVWSILYLLVVNHGAVHPLIKVDNDGMHVPYKAMQELATACFADYDDLVAPPKSFESIKDDKDWGAYVLQMSDSGPDYCKILSSVALPDGGYNVNVGYFDDEEAPLSATFVFVIKPNPYAKMVSDPLFHFSIQSGKRL